VKIFSHKGKVKHAVEVAALEIRRDALDMAFKLRGMYAPVQVEQENKQTVKCIVIDVPRPKRPIPPPTMVTLAEPVEVETPAASKTQAQLESEIKRAKDEEKKKFQ
jgi:hypothetical protein